MPRLRMDVCFRNVRRKKGTVTTLVDLVLCDFRAQGIGAEDGANRLKVAPHLNTFRHAVALPGTKRNSQSDLPADESCIYKFIGISYRRQRV